jgi:hypothetical protein
MRSPRLDFGRSSPLPLCSSAPLPTPQALRFLILDWVDGRWIRLRPPGFAVTGPASGIRVGGKVVVQKLTPKPKRTLRGIW